DLYGAVMYGGTGAENGYIVDGVNVTGMVYGTPSLLITTAGETAPLKRLNYDTVQEIQVMTTGLNAEYGRMTGGIVNAITKSGGNAFHGSLYGFFEGGGLRAKESSASQRPLSTTTVTDIPRLGDGGGDLGGYLLKDKLWFYGAYNPT